MAKKEVYSVYDTKVQFFHTPMFMRNAGEALRSWTEEANRDDSAISRHPSDFELFHLGTFDDQTGKFEMLTSPQGLGLAVQYKNTPTAPTPLFNQSKGN